MKSLKLIVHFLLVKAMVLTLALSLAHADKPNAQVYEKSSGSDAPDRKKMDMKEYNICMNGEGITTVIYDGYRLDLRKGQCAKITSANVRVMPPEKQQEKSGGGLRYHTYTYPSASQKGGLSRPRSRRYH